MARADLTQLLGHVGEEAVQSDESAVSEDAIDAPSPPRAKPERSGASLAGKPTNRRPAANKPGPEVEPGAAYLRFVRKETRLRDDQQNALTQHARRLSRARTQPGPRITDNTLIRVAVDLLLARIENASGDDETAILESLNQ